MLKRLLSSVLVCSLALPAFLGVGISAASDEEINAPVMGKNNIIVEEPNLIAIPVDAEYDLGDNVYCVSAAELIRPVLLSSNGSSTYNYSDKLTGNAKIAYDAMKEAIEADLANTSETELKNTVVQIDGSDDYEELMRAYCFLVADNPEYFWLYNSKFYFGSDLNDEGEEIPCMGVEFGYCYGYDAGNVKSRYNTLMTEVKSVVSKASEYSTDYEKIRYFAEYLSDKTTYDYDAADLELDLGPDDEGYENCWNAYGGLIDGRGVCEAYAEAFKVLCDAAGITCINMYSVDHEWNAVKLGGNWYYVDVTWFDLDPETDNDLQYWEEWIAAGTATAKKLDSGVSHTPVTGYYIVLNIDAGIEYPDISEKDYDPTEPEPEPEVTTTTEATTTEATTTTTTTAETTTTTTTAETTTTTTTAETTTTTTAATEATTTTTAATPDSTTSTTAAESEATTTTTVSESETTTTTAASTPDNTTQAPETSSSTEATTPEPAATTPEVTTPEPEATTPEVTTAEPVTTTTEPDVQVSEETTTEPTEATTTEPAPQETTAETTEPDVISPDEVNITVNNSNSNENFSGVSLDTESINRLKEEIVAQYLTNEEKAAVASGSQLDIVLSAEAVEAAVSALDIQVTETAIASTSYVVGQYLNIELKKLVDGHQTGKITELSEPISIVVDVPLTLLQTNRVFAIVRVHEGEADILSDQDDDPNTITFLTDRFSTYSIVYYDTDGTDGVDVTDSTNGSDYDYGNYVTDITDGANGGGDNNVNTGVVLAVVPFIASVIGVIASKKRK